MNKDDLGDRMKAYEAMFQQTIPDSKLIYARVDGRTFHSLVKRWKLGFANQTMIDAMRYAAATTAQNFNADVAYVQSDECSFAWKINPNPQSQRIFNGRTDKLLSLLAADYSVNFLTWMIMQTTESFPGALPIFDCRLVPFGDSSELQLMFYWRYLDGRRNGLQAFIQKTYGHRAVQGKSQVEMLAKMMEDGKNDEFIKLPDAFRSGSFFINPKHEEQLGCARWVTHRQFVDNFQLIFRESVQ